MKLKIDTQARDDKGNPVEGGGTAEIQIQRRSKVAGHDEQGNPVLLWEDASGRRAANELVEIDLKPGERLIITEKPNA